MIFQVGRTQIEYSPGHEPPPVSGAYRCPRGTGWWLVDVPSLEALVELAREEREPVIIFPADAHSVHPRLRENPMPYGVG